MGIEKSGIERSLTKGQEMLLAKDARELAVDPNRYPKTFAKQVESFNSSRANMEALASPRLDNSLRTTGVNPSDIENGLEGIYRQAQSGLHLPSYYFRPEPSAFADEISTEGLHLPTSYTKEKRGAMLRHMLSFLKMIVMVEQMNASSNPYPHSALNNINRSIILAERTMNKIIGSSEWKAAIAIKPPAGLTDDDLLSEEGKSGLTRIVTQAAHEVQMEMRQNPPRHSFGGLHMFV